MMSKGWRILMWSKSMMFFNFVIFLGTEWCLYLAFERVAEMWLSLKQILCKQILKWRFVCRQYIGECSRTHLSGNKEQDWAEGEGVSFESTGNSGAWMALPSHLILREGSHHYHPRAHKRTDQPREVECIPLGKVASFSYWQFLKGNLAVTL